MLVEYKDSTMIKGIEFLIECLQSSISYAGGKDLLAFKNVEYILV